MEQIFSHIIHTAAILLMAGLLIYAFLKKGKSPIWIEWSWFSLQVIILTIYALQDKYFWMVPQVVLVGMFAWLLVRKASFAAEIKGYKEGMETVNEIWHSRIDNLNSKFEKEESSTTMEQ